MYLGVGTSFDIKKYRSDYKALTVEDFVCEVHGAIRASPVPTANMYPSDRVKINKYIEITTNGYPRIQSNSYLVKSYNAATGILIAYYRLESCHIGENDFWIEGAVRTDISARVYCVK